MVLLTSVFSTTLTKRLEIRDRQCLSTSVRNHWGQADKEYAAWCWVGWVGYTPQKSNDAPLSTKRKSLMVQVWCVLVKDALTSLALLWVVIMMTLAWHYWCELRTERWYKKKKIIRVWSSPACVFFSIWCCVCARARWRPAQPNQLQAHNTRPMMLPVHADLPAESQKPPVEFLPKQLFATPSFFFASIKPSVLLLISVPGPTFDLTGPRRWIKPRRTSVPPSSTDVRRLLLLVRRFGSFCCLCIFPSSGWDGIYSMLMWWSLPCCKLQFWFEMETGMEQIGSRLQALKRLYVRAASASQGSGTAHEKCNIKIANFTASLLF